MIVWDWLEGLGVRILGWFGLSAAMLIAWLLERAGVHCLLISLTVLVVVPLFNFAGHRLITVARP